jgi:hypothetical protein
MSIPDRRARLDRAHRVLSIRRQCQLLGLARSGVYRRRAPASWRWCLAHILSCCNSTWHTPILAGKRREKTWQIQLHSANFKPSSSAELTRPRAKPRISRQKLA